MAMQQALIPIDLGTQGLQTKTDKSKLLVGQMLVLENAIFSTPGLIQKRNGYDALLRAIQYTTTPVTVTDTGGAGIVTTTAYTFSINQAFKFIGTGTLSTGVLTKTGGTGDATLTFSYWTGDAPIYTFTITSGNATTGATYTNNGVTYTVVTTVASSTTVTLSGASQPSDASKDTTYYVSRISSATAFYFSRTLGGEEIVLTASGSGSILFVPIVDAVASGSALTTFKTELDLFSGAELFAYSPSLQQWASKGVATSVALTTNPIARNSYQQTVPDMAYHASGVKVFTWEDSSGGSRYSVIDATTNEQMISNRLIATTAAQPKPFMIGNYCVILYQDSVSFALNYIAFSVLTPGSLVPGGPFTMSALLHHTDILFDGVVMNNVLFVAFNNTSAGTSVVRLSSTLVLSSHVDTAGAAVQAINIAADTDLSQVWVTYATATTTHAYVHRYPPSQSAVVTVNSATPGVVTAPANTPFYADQAFVFGGSGTPATGTTLGTIYYVRNVLSLTTFTFSLTVGGAEINTTGASSGTITFNPQFEIVLASTSIYGHGGITIKNITNFVRDGQAQILLHSLGSQSYYDTLNRLTMYNTGVVGSIDVVLNSVGLASKQFEYNDATYVLIEHDSNLQPTYFLLQLGVSGSSSYPGTTNRIVCKISPSLGGGRPVKSMLPEIAILDSSTFAVATLIKDLLTTVSDDNSTAIYSQTGVVEAVLDFTSNLTYRTLEMANNLHISGGILSCYDGANVVEQGFHLYPENVTVTAKTPDATYTTVDTHSNTTIDNISDTSNMFVGMGISGAGIVAGTTIVSIDSSDTITISVAATATATITITVVAGNISAGTRQYSFIYQWVDNQGQIHQSAPSIPESVTNSGLASGNTITIPMLRITAKAGLAQPVTIVGYRTQAAGTVFTQFTSITSPLINNPYNGTQLYTTFDSATDASILGNPVLYTSGGVIENIAAPAIDTMCTYQGRVVAIPSENKLAFWYSKQVIPGTPVEFSDVLVQNIDARGGNLTACAPMDDKLVLFKKTSIFMVSGDGPTPTGSDNTFSPAQLITTDGGSVGPFVVVVPTGLMYKSEKGIYHLTRSGVAEYIGAPVAAYDSANLTSAKLIPNTTQVRFTLDTGDTLVYDYFVAQWAVFKNATRTDVVDAAVHNDTYTYLLSDGTVMVESPTNYTDAGQFIKLRLQTSWMSFAQLTGFQRAFRLMVQGNYISPHQLLMQIAYDFIPNFTQQVTINAGTLLEPEVYGESTPYGSDDVYGGAYPEYAFQVYLTKQKCTSIQLSIEDVGTQPYGEGFSISTLSMLVGTMKGFNRLPDTRKFG